jgi:RNA polymerase sigma factor (TIGR02999 family)
MADVTHILQCIEQGHDKATADLFPLVYAELRRLAAGQMAGERADHTLSATALVHEAYVRLVDVNTASGWQSRRHFFAAAAEAMRRILIDHARRRGRSKRGGDRQRVEVDEFVVELPADPDLLLDLDESLVQLAEEDPDAAELVKLRLFAGLSTAEAGKLLGLSRRAAYRNWDYVRSWFAVRHEAAES